MRESAEERERERERQRERERERERREGVCVCLCERKSERECVCECVCMCMCVERESHSLVQGQIYGGKPAEVGWWSLLAVNWTLRWESVATPWLPHHKPGTSIPPNENTTHSSVQKTAQLSPCIWSFGPIEVVNSRTAANSERHIPYFDTFL